MSITKRELITSIFLLCFGEGRSGSSPSVTVETVRAAKSQALMFKAHIGNGGDQPNIWGSGSTPKRAMNELLMKVTEAAMEVIERNTKFQNDITHLLLLRVRES